MTNEFYEARHALVTTTHKEDDCILCRVNCDSIKMEKDVMGRYHTTCDCPKHTWDEREQAIDLILENR